MREKRSSEPECSFCRKPQSCIRKLISNPDHPRVYICDECIRVCATILEDDAAAPERQSKAPPAPPGSPLSHPMAAELAELIALVEQWITREASGGDASAELDQLRAAAKLMFVNPDA